MGIWADLKEKFKSDPKFRNRVLVSLGIAASAGTVYYYGRKHGFAKAERQLSQWVEEDDGE